MCVSVCDSCVIYANLHAFLDFSRTDIINKAVIQRGKNKQIATPLRVYICVKCRMIYLRMDETDPKCGGESGQSEGECRIILLRNI